MGSVPTIDLTPWFAGTERDRRAVADQVDQALQSVGFFLLTGHGVTAHERARVRAGARRFFALPAATKQAYAVTVGEANGDAEGTPTPPDLKESFAVDADPRPASRISTHTGSRTTSFPPRSPNSADASPATWPGCAPWPTNC